jgi:Na+-driven multidrug efflux pump
LAVFLIAQIILGTSWPFSAYLRAHKKEPLMYISVVQSLLIVIFTYLLTPKYSVLGIAIGYLISLSIGLPVSIIIWNKYRKKWMNEL